MAATGSGTDSVASWAQSGSIGEGTDAGLALLR